MAQLFATLFFAGVLGIAVAVLWSVIANNRALVMANLPWATGHESRPEALVRGASRDGSNYWATPSINSDTPSRAITVSPAITR